MQNVERVFIIGMGGFVGANLRYLVQGWAAARWGAAFPYGTLIANTSGSFLIGLFLTLATGRFLISPNWRFFLAVGILGGYTTFSSFSYETLSLAAGGALVRAVANLLLNVVLGLSAAFLGIGLARWLGR